MGFGHKSGGGKLGLGSFLQGGGESSCCFQVKPQAWTSGKRSSQLATPARLGFILTGGIRTRWVPPVPNTALKLSGPARSDHPGRRQRDPHAFGSPDHPSPWGGLALLQTQEYGFPSVSVKHFSFSTERFYIVLKSTWVSLQPVLLYEA